MSSFIRNIVFSVAFLTVYALPQPLSAAPLSDKKMQAFAAAFWQKDYSKALDLLEAESAINLPLLKENTREDYLTNQLALEAQIANAKWLGKLGDPCPNLRRASAFQTDLMAGYFMPLPNPENIETETRYNRSELDELIHDTGCAEAITSTPSPDLLGTYYLAGVMETGSGLRLIDDGHYEWFLTVGGLDLYSKGVWQRRGDAVQMIAVPHPEQKDFLQVGAVHPYSPREKQANGDANYAIHFVGTYGELPEYNRFSGFVYFSYPDGRTVPAGYVQDGRLDLVLNPQDLPGEIKIQPRSGREPENVETFRIPIQADTVQEFIYDQKLHNITRPPPSMLLYVDGENLKSDMFSKGAYIRQKKERP